MAKEEEILFSLSLLKAGQLINMWWKSQDSSPRLGGQQTKLCSRIYLKDWLDSKSRPSVNVEYRGDLTTVWRLRPETKVGRKYLGNEFEISNTYETGRFSRCNMHRIYDRVWLNWRWDAKRGRLEKCCWRDWSKSVLSRFPGYQYARELVGRKWRKIRR